MVERSPEKAGVGGSIPSLATIENVVVQFNTVAGDTTSSVRATLLILAVRSQ